jgi:type IV pilus modification protein PilV
VFTLGLAGFSALLLSSMIGSTQARREGIASIAASNLAEQIRLNPAAIDNYLNPPEYISKICSGDTNCSPAQQADYDFRFWQLELADRIRHARGLVCHDETPDDGHAANEQCDGSGPLIIKIFWSGQPADAENAPVQYRYVMQLS